MAANKIKISNTGENMNAALDLTEKTAKSMGLSSRDTLRLRLLAEEMMSMVRAITGSLNTKALAANWCCPQNLNWTTENVRSSSQCLPPGRILRRPA